MDDRCAQESNAEVSGSRRSLRSHARLLAGLVAVALVVAIGVFSQTTTPSAPISGTATVESLKAPEPARGPVVAPPVPRADGPALTIDAPSLVFDHDAATVHYTTEAASASWKVLDEENRLVDSGTVNSPRGSGNVNLNALGPGYYTLAVSAGPESAQTTRVTGLAVLGPLPAQAAGAGSPFGIGMHVTSPIDRGLIPTVAQVGFGHARFDMKWDAVEKSKGSYTFPKSYDEIMEAFRSRGIKPLPIADYGNPLYDDGLPPSSPSALAALAKFASAVVDRYGDTTSDIQVYNEPNLALFRSACGAEPNCYMPMLKAMYERVKADHPDATVVGASVSGLALDWLNRLFDLGGLDCMDVLSLHPYRYPAVPEGLADDLGKLRQSIRDHNGGKDKPIWLTELGWPTHEGGGTTERQQADYLVRSEVVAFANGVTGFYWYDLVNDGKNATNKEHNFGLMRQPAPGVKVVAPKPALVTQAVTIRQLAGRSFAGEDKLPVPMHSVRFGSDADTTRVMWALEPRAVSISATGPITVADAYGRSRTLAPADGVVRLSLDEHPVFVTGPVTAIKSS